MQGWELIPLRGRALLPLSSFPLAFQRPFLRCAVAPFPCLVAFGKSPLLGGFRGSFNFSLFLFPFSFEEFQKLFACSSLSLRNPFVSLPPHSELLWRRFFFVNRRRFVSFAFFFTPQRYAFFLKQQSFVTTLVQSCHEF